MATDPTALVVRFIPVILLNKQRIMFIKRIIYALLVCYQSFWTLIICSWKCTTTDPTALYYEVSM